MSVLLGRRLPHPPGGRCFVGKMASPGPPEKDVDRLTDRRVWKQSRHDQLRKLRWGSPAHTKSRGDVVRVDEDLADPHRRERLSVGGSEMPRAVSGINGLDDAGEDVSPGLYDFQDIGGAGSSEYTPSVESAALEVRNEPWWRSLPVPYAPFCPHPPRAGTGISERAFGAASHAAALVAQSADGRARPGDCL